MCRTTFTKWIFSWMANFKVDFRKPFGSWKYHPKILACDGTKLGMFLRNTNFKARETPTTDIILTPHHKRTDRQFFSYSEKDSSSVKRVKWQAQESMSYFVATSRVA